jgi:hypothetical protein
MAAADGPTAVGGRSRRLENGPVMPVELALALRDAGLAWKPSPGDHFAIPDRDLDGEVFVLSNMTIEIHDLPEGPVIGFNGTTEWALDDLEKDEAIWLPREDQLRELLGNAFHQLAREGQEYRVTATIDGVASEFTGGCAEEAYGRALLRIVTGANR